MCDYEKELLEQDPIEQDPIEKHEDFIVEQYLKSKQIYDRDIFVVNDDLSLKNEDLPF